MTSCSSFAQSWCTSSFPSLVSDSCTVVLTVGDPISIGMTTFISYAKANRVTLVDHLLVVL